HHHRYGLYRLQILGRIARHQEEVRAFALLDRARALLLADVARAVERRALQDLRRRHAGGLIELELAVIRERAAGVRAEDDEHAAVVQHADDAYQLVERLFVGLRIAGRRRIDQGLLEVALRADG